MNNQHAKILLPIFLLGLLYLPLAGCSSDPSRPAPASIPTATPLHEEAQPTPTRTVVTPTPTSTLIQPSATPATTATNTPVPTPAPMTVVKEENGWVTYRNEMVGYEISLPKSYQIKGESPAVGFIGPGLLGPAVPDEEIASLVAKYYGESLMIWMRETDSSGQFKPWGISIYAYDILAKKLGAAISPGGVGDYELDKASETLTIDGQTYEVTFTVLQKNNQAVQELGVLYLEKGGVEFMFGYFPEKDNPEAYQAYRKEIWPVVRRIIESYKYLPEK